MEKLKSLLLLLFLPFIGYSQCDVFIDGEVEVIDNDSGIKFVFDITNNSGTDWYGDVVKLYWTLNSSAPIWEIDYTTNTSSPPIADGETRTITTPWFDFPTLPSWFPDDPTPANPWLESSEWAYYDINVTGGPFTGAWSPMNLRLGGCSNDMDGDGFLDQNVKDENGDPYYGPFNSSCPDQDHDAFCDCDIDFIGFDPITYDASIAIISHWNCGQPLNGGSQSSEMDHVNMLQIGAHIPGWDYQWTDCVVPDTSFHPGWTYDNPISFNEYYAGDTINYNLFSDETTYDDCFQEILESDTLSACLEIVLWQINYSQTLHIWEGGWASNEDMAGFPQTQPYPDISIELNSINICDAPPPLYPGCTDPEAENYNPEADFDDGSCIDPPIYGCTDPTACNYNFLATQNDGSCITCDTPYEEGLACDEYQSPGYWDWYLSIFDCIQEGCTDPDAINYDEEADEDDGSCEYSPDAFPGAGFNGTFCNGGEPANSWTITVYNPNTGNFNATDTLFVYCVEIPEIGFDECRNGYEVSQYWMPPGEGQYINNVIIPEDIETFTVNVYYAEDEYEEYASNNSIIVQNIIQDPGVCIFPGCTDICAINYDQFATEDDGSCEYETLVDTVYIDNFIYDTLYIDNFIYDTLYMTEYIYDTLYIDNYIYEYDTVYVTETEYITDTLYVTEYITLTDTITEYIIQEILIDCNTGLPCDEDPPGLDCPDWTTLHIPNTFTPNNDGINDVWKIVYDLDCWEDVEFWVYNRWGVEIYHDYGDSFDSYPFWDGSVNNGDYYVSDGVYFYKVRGKKVGRVEVIEAVGHITVFR